MNKNPNQLLACHYGASVVVSFVVLSLFTAWPV